LLSRLGKNPEAIAEIDRALEIEPMNLVYRSNHGGLLAWAGNYDEAIADLEKTLELDENFASTLGNLGNAYQFKGDHAKSIEIRSRELEVSGNQIEAARVRDVFAKSGWNGYLRYMVQSRPAYASFYGLAICYAELGEKDKAFQALNRSYEIRESLIQRIKVDPRLSSLRGDPRFDELVRRIGLP
jgi:tetratricopeptide (TPR) repeat protein